MTTTMLVLGTIQLGVGLILAVVLAFITRDHVRATRRAHERERRRRHARRDDDGAT